MKLIKIDTNKHINIDAICSVEVETDEQELSIKDGCGGSPTKKKVSETTTIKIITADGEKHDVAKELVSCIYDVLLGFQVGGCMGMVRQVYALILSFGAGLLAVFAFYVSVLLALRYTGLVESYQIYGRQMDSGSIYHIVGFVVFILFGIFLSALAFVLVKRRLLLNTTESKGLGPN